MQKNITPHIKKFNKPAVRTMIIVFVLSVSVAIFGRIMMDHVLKQYARERLFRWTESIINEAPILATVDMDEEATPGSLEQIAYKLYIIDGANSQEIYSAQIDEDFYEDSRLQIFYADESNPFKKQHFKYLIINTKPIRTIGIYMTKYIQGTQYVLCGYVPDNVFYHNHNTQNILIVYAIISSIMVLITMASAGCLVKYIRLCREQNIIIQEKMAAEEAEQIQADFFTRMSHEFRTPLNGILGMNEIIRRDHPDTKTQEYTKHIEESANSLLSMINEILDHAKLDNGKMELIEDEYSLQNVANYVKYSLQTQAEKKNLNFNVIINKRCPDKLYGDEKNIERLVINLGSNAIKYTKEGSVDILFDWDADILNITVSDTGIGMDESELPHLFEKYSRADLKQNSQIEGTGLGLSIVKSLTDLMHGEIDVESTINKGTTFVVRVSQKQPENHCMLADDETFIAPDLHVLIVDDTQLNLDVITKILAPTKAVADTALSGVQALNMVKEQFYDIIFLDARMPEMSGLETLNKLKQQQETTDTKIIMLTADTNQKNKQQTLEAGVDAYLEKPVPAQILRNTIVQFADPEKITIVKQETVSSTLPAWLLEHKEFNVQMGVTNCGSESDYMEAIARFAQYAPAKIEEIQEYIQKNDIDNFIIKVHAIKSSTRTLGMMNLSQIALNLEEAGNNQDIAYIHAHVGTFLALYGTLSCELVSRLSNTEQPEKPKQVIEKEAIFGIAQHLKGYVDDFNDEAVGSMLRALQLYDFPEEIQPQFKQIKTAFDNVDWIQMEKAVNEIIEISSEWT